MIVEVLYPGIGDGHVLRFVVAAGDSGLNLTEATVGELLVRKESGEEVTWIAELDSATSSSVNVDYEFVGTELDAQDVGTLRVYPRLTFPDGSEFRGDTVLVPVDPSFAY